MIKHASYPTYKIETIGISGKKNTDKKLFAELLQNYLENVTKKQIVKTGFAEPLYETLISLFSPRLTWDHFRDKEADIPGMIVNGHPATSRSLIQSLGDYCKSVYPNVLIDRVFKHRLHDYLYIIHDVRLPVEAEAILEHKGLLIRVEKSDNDGDSHETETALDSFDFPVIVECASREDMKQAVEEIVRSIKV